MLLGRPAANVTPQAVAEAIDKTIEDFEGRYIEKLARISWKQVKSEQKGVDEGVKKPNKALPRNRMQYLPITMKPKKTLTKEELRSFAAHHSLAENFQK